MRVGTVVLMFTEKVARICEMNMVWVICKITEVGI